MQQTITYKGRKHRVFTVDLNGIPFDIILFPTAYRDNDTLAVLAYLVEDGMVGDSFSVLTVNLDSYTGDQMQSDCDAYIDTNNNNSWDILGFLKEQSIAEFAGVFTPSGYCMYPLYTFKTESFYAD